jgi:hypothetical protein
MGFVYDLPLVDWHFLIYGPHTVWSAHEQSDDAPEFQNMKLFEGFQNGRTTIWKGSEYLKYVVVCIAVTIDTSYMSVILAEQDNYKNIIVMPGNSFYTTYPSAVFPTKDTAEWFLTNAWEEYCINGPTPAIMKEEEFCVNNREHTLLTVDDLGELLKRYDNQSELPESEGPFVLQFTVLKKRKRTTVDVTIEPDGRRNIQTKQIRKAISRVTTLSLFEEIYYKKREAYWFVLCARRFGLYKDVVNLIVKFILQ